MVAIYAYESSLFKSLHPFEIAKDRLDQVASQIDKLGEIICQYGLQEDVGICLLHKHFELSNDELLVRFYTDSQIVIEPQQVKDPGLVIPYIWGFFPGSDEIKLAPLEFLAKDQKTDVLEPVSKKLAQNKEFLDHFAATLKEVQVMDVFGLSLIPEKLFTLNDDMTLIESEDQNNRLLYIKPYPKEELAGPHITQTLWTFSKNEEEHRYLKPLACRHCRHCGLHCVIHFANETI